MRAVKAAMQLDPRFSAVFVSPSFSSPLSLSLSLSLPLFSFFFFFVFPPLPPLPNHRAFRCVGRASEFKSKRGRVRFDALVN